MKRNAELDQWQPQSEEQNDPLPLNTTAPESVRRRETAQTHNPAKHNSNRLWIASGIVVLLAGGLFWAVTSWRATGVSLHAVDIGSDQLRIDWDHAANAIQHSVGGELQIQDGNEEVRSKFSREFLLTGNVTYLRTNRQVTVQLILHRADGRTVTEVTGFSGTPVLNAAVRAPVSTVALSGAPAETLSRIDVTVTPSQRDQESQKLAEPERAAAAAPVELAGNRTAADPSGLRRWVPPTPAVHPANSELPSPPSLGESAPAPLANFIPRPTPPHGVAPPPDVLPSSGRLIWTGKLERGGTIRILGDHASLGRLTGSLPGVPVRVRVFPTELTQNGLKVFTGEPLAVGIPEAAGAQNGWMATTWALNTKRASDLRIVEAPGQDNNWNRLSVRAERGDHAVIVLTWERLPGGGR